MALSSTEYLAAIFPAPDIFTCTQSDVERSRLNSVEGRGSRCARGSLHGFPSCRAATENSCGAGSTWVFLKWLAWNTEDHCSGLQIRVQQRNLTNERSAKTGKKQEITAQGVCSVPLST